MQNKRSLYQCFNAKVKGNMIYCSKGYKLGKADSRHIGIQRLILGAPLELSVCQSCADYDEMGLPVPKEERGWR